MRDGQINPCYKLPIWFVGMVQLFKRDLTQEKKPICTVSQSAVSVYPVNKAKLLSVFEKHGIIETRTL